MYSIGSTFANQLRNLLILGANESEDVKDKSEHLLVGPMNFPLPVLVIPEALVWREICLVPDQRKVSTFQWITKHSLGIRIFELHWPAKKTHGIILVHGASNLLAEVPSVATQSLVFRYVGAVKPLLEEAHLCVEGTIDKIPHECVGGPIKYFVGRKRSR